MPSYDIITDVLWSNSYLLALLFMLLGLVFVPGIFSVKPVQSAALEVPQLLAPVSIPVVNSASLSAELTMKAQLLSAISAQAVMVMDVDSGAVLLSKNETEAQYPASTTKLMTALIARELFDIHEQVTITEADVSEGTVVGFKPGEKVTVRELLSALLVQSANDAAVALANHYPPGAAEFVTLMNEKSQALYLSQTTFYNPTGIDHPDQVSSAQDLGIIAREVIKDPVLAEIIQLKTVTIGTQPAHQLHNTHALLGKRGVIGVKTGTTALAGEVLITLVKSDSHRVLIVLLASQKRYDDTERIMDWIEKSYSWQSVDALLTLYATK